MKRIICLLFGHDYEWRRVKIPAGMLALALGRQHDDLYKLRGTCRRCGHWRSAIPPEHALAVPDCFPHLQKFVRDHIRDG